ncbi:unnamed protein product [Protopolystoma xenopodis]|uniref:Maestro/Maestro-like HEAT-repeats domain-containing protein n=1 Tax=Protopolystoma xenopodis TaxID=117903 RepID=A0A3S5B2B2_9PLAT|nr:unnamed protein product [Protopolystoma xenopodis]
MNAESSQFGIPIEFSNASYHSSADFGAAADYSRTSGSPINAICLGHGSCLDIIRRSATQLLSSLACAMDDRQDCDSSILLASLHGLRLVISCITEAQLRPVLASVCTRLLPVYTAESALVRAGAFHLFAGLAGFATNIRTKSAEDGLGQFIQKAYQASGPRGSLRDSAERHVRAEPSRLDEPEATRSRGIVAKGDSWSKNVGTTRQRTEIGPDVEEDWSPSYSLLASQAESVFIPMLLHLADPNPLVVHACKASLKLVCVIASLINSIHMHQFPF